MNYRKIFSSILLFLLFVSTLKAQRGANTFTINYTAAFPTGSLKDIVKKNSFRGFDASLLHGVSENVSLGLSTGFQDFYQKNPRQLYKLADGSDLSAVLTYSIQTIPILAKAKYNFSPEARVQPYVVVGAGANFIQFQQLLGQFGESQGKVRIAARSEAGVLIPFNQGGTGFNIGASYNIMPLNMDDVKNLNNLIVHAGISIPIRK